MFRFKRSQRTSNRRNVIYCFMLARICIQFYIEFLKAGPHYLIYGRFSYRFTQFQMKIQIPYPWCVFLAFSRFLLIHTSNNFTMILSRFPFSYKTISHQQIFPSLNITVLLCFMDFCWWDWLIRLFVQLNVDFFVLFVHSSNIVLFSRFCSLSWSTTMHTQ